jgi:hypothetical protein
VQLFEFRGLFDRQTLVEISKIIVRALWLNTLVEFNVLFGLGMLIKLSINYLSSLSSMSSTSSTSSRSAWLQMHARLLAVQFMEVYADEQWPHEIVLMLHRRRLALNKLSVLRSTIKKLASPPLVTKIVDFLRLPPIHLSSDYLTRVGVPTGEVYVTLRRWFWMWGGGLPVPRCLRRLVSVDAAHLRAVKEEPAEPGDSHATTLAEPMRQRQRMT